MFHTWADSFALDSSPWRSKIQDRRTSYAPLLVLLGYLPVAAAVLRKHSFCLNIYIFVKL